MRGHKKEILYSESIHKIGKELGKTDLSGVTDEEYIDLLTRHTSNLIELLEKLNNEIELEDSVESILSIFFDKLHEPISVIDRHARVIYYNACWRKYFTNTRLHHSFNEILSPAKSGLLNETIKKCENERKTMFFSLQSGKKRNFISLVPFNNFKGEHNFMVSFIGDEALRHLRLNGYEGSAKIKESDELADGQNIYGKPENIEQLVLELLDGFYFTISRQGEFLYVSKSVGEKLGVDHMDIVGKSLNFLFTKASCVKIEEWIGQLPANVKTRLKQTKLEVEAVHIASGIQNYSLTLSPAANTEFLMGICIDNQDNRIKFDALTTARNTAEMNDRLKSDFLANMSHEIRTPLNGIIGFSSMLGREDLPEEKREKYLRIIRSSTSHLLTLVSDIIDISKIEAGQLKIINNKVDVHQMFEDLQATFVAEAKRLGKKNIRLVKQVEKPNAGLFIKSDEIRLKQVLNNLLGNALKFTNVGEVRFGYSITDYQTIRFFVRDSGVGLSKVAQRSIFNRFKQTNEGEKDKYKGTGLGLAISKGIIDLMGGKIGVQSQQGQGSEFFFTLPLIQCE